MLYFLFLPGILFFLNPEYEYEYEYMFGYSPGPLFPAPFVYFSQEVKG